MSKSIPSGIRARYALASLGIVAAGLAGAELVAGSYADQQRLEQHERRLMTTSQVRSRLESSLNSTVFLAHGLVAYVAGVKTPSPEEADRALRALYESDPRIRNVGLAPDNVIRHVYPHQGNDKAVGLRFADRPDQWPSVEKAMRTRQSVLVGPVNLVQGGRAIINRTPVFLDDQSFWGTVSTVIDITRLLEDIDLPSTGSNLRFSLYGNSTDPAHNRIFGEDEPDTPDAIRMNIEVPGGQWTLVSNPTVASAANREAMLIRALLGLGSLTLGLFSYIVLSGRSNAQALAIRLGEVNESLAQANEELRRLSSRDSLTKLLNRGAFEQAFEDHWLRCSQQRVSLSILMIDIDHFKSINDRFGHAAGDAALVEVATTIRQEARRGDIVARYGGEEFAVMTSDLSEASLRALAERIRARVEACHVELPDPESLCPTITISIGAARQVPVPSTPAQLLVQRADAALYRAKRDGRNRVAFDTEPVQPEASPGPVRGRHILRQ